MVAAANSRVWSASFRSVIASSGCIAGQRYDTLPTSEEPCGPRPRVHSTPYCAMISSAIFSAAGFGRTGSKCPSKRSHETSVAVATAAPLAQRKTPSVSSSSMFFSGARASTRQTALSGIMFAAPETCVINACRRQPSRMWRRSMFIASMKSSAPLCALRPSHGEPAECAVCPVKVKSKPLRPSAR